MGAGHHARGCRVVLSDQVRPSPCRRARWGVGGICYARRPLSSPPRMLRASSTEALAAAIEHDEWEHGANVDT